MQLKKPLTLLLTIVCWSYFSLTPIQAQTPYPNKSIRLIVVAPPGGTLDSVSRAFATTLAEGLEQSVVVENRAGAGGSVGAAEVAAARPDGYTLGMIYDTHAVNQHLYKNLRYDTFKSFDYVSRIVTSPQILVAAAAFPASNVSEFIRYVKANPGKVNYASTGTGSSNHLNALLLANHAGLDMVHIPYKGGPAALTDMMGGRIDLMVVSAPSTMSYIQTGRVKVLGIGVNYPLPQLGGIPPISDTIPGYDAGLWIGLVAPAGLPPEVLARIQKETQAALSKRELREKLTAAGYQINASTSNEFTSFMRTEYDKLGKVIRDGKIVVE